MCKPQKRGGHMDEKELCHHGFGKLRALDGAKRAMRETHDEGHQSL